MGEGTIEWKKGDFCRTVFLEDNLEYEGVLDSLQETEDHQKYGVVKFIGYGNEQTCWVQELRPSSGPQARKEQEDQAAGVAPQQEESTKDWKVGAPCRAVFTEDGVEYEADITSLDKDESGREYAQLTFIGYNNTQTVWLDEILDSKGKEARAQQLTDAGVDPVTAAGDAGGENSEFDVGHNCRIIYSGNNQEYEGKVVEVAVDEAGRKYANVRLSGYGIEDTVWIDQLMPSKGSDARKLQRKEAKEKPLETCPAKPEEAKPEKAKPEETKPEPEKKKEEIEAVVIKEKVIEEPVKQEAVIKQKPEKVVVENTTPVKEDTVVKKPDTPIPLNYKKGDHVRTIYSEDGLEYEGKLISIDKDDEGKEYVTVMFWGYLNEETVWLDELMPSNGPESIAAQEKAASSTAAAAADDVPNGETTAAAVSSSSEHAKSNVEPNETDDSSVTITSSLNDEIKVKLYFAEKLEKCNKEIETLENKVAVLTKQNDDLKQGSANQASNNAQSSVELKNAQEKYQNLTKKYTELEKKLEAMETKDQENVQNFNKLQEDNKIFDKKNADLKVQIRSAEDKIVELSSKVSNLESKNKELMKSVDNNGNIKSATPDQYRVLSEKYNEMEIKLSRCTADAKILISKVEQLKSENAKLKEDKQELMDELDQYGANGPADTSSISVEEFRPMRSPVPDRTLMMGGNMLMANQVGGAAAGFQPVLCYLPTMQPQANRYPTVNTTVQPNVARKTLFPNNSNATSQSAASTTLGDSRRTLRRPMSTTSSVTEATNGKLSIVCKGAAGSEKVVRELTSDCIEQSRINFIFEELKSELLNLMMDDCGHKVILTLMKIGSEAHQFAITRTIWENSDQLAKTHGGVELILESMSVKIMTTAFKGILEKFIKNDNLKDYMNHEHTHRVVVQIIQLIKPKDLITAIYNNLETLWNSEYGTAVIRAAIGSYVHEDIKQILGTLVSNCSKIEQLTYGLSIIDEILMKHVSTKNLDDDCIKNIFDKLSPYAWMYLSNNLGKTPEGVSLLKKYNIL